MDCVATFHDKQSYNLTELTPDVPLQSRITPFLLRSLPVTLAEIPGRFSSSLLPPSFAPGRCAATFLSEAVSPVQALSRLAVGA